MTAGKTTFVLEADEAKVVAAYLKVADAQKQNIDLTRQMNRENQQTSKGMEAGFRGVAGALGLLSVPVVFMTQVRKIIDELERVKNLRKEMGETALTVEQLAMKIAQLRGDVTTGGVTAVTRDMTEISKQAAVSLEVASKSLFYAESAMGMGPRAKSAALAISRFAGPAGLTPEETMLIPKLFDIMKADTEAKQMQVLNQLNAATRASIAETGEFIAPFMKPMVADIQRGFTLPQSLARMVAAVQVTGSVEEAGTISATALDIAAGRTEEALKFYSKQARRKGLDYGKMTDPERYEFARRLFEEAEAGGPGAMDILKTKVGAKGFHAIRAMFGETGKRKYFEVLPQIEEAVSSTMVEQMAKQYQDLMTAETAKMTTQAQIGRARIGGIQRPQIVFDKMVTEILDQAKAQEQGWREYIAMSWPGMKTTERYSIGRLLIERNLLAGLENLPRGTRQYKELIDLWNERNKTAYALEPDYLKRVYEATEGFTLPAKYGFPHGLPSEDTSAGLAYRIYGRGMESYFGKSDKEIGGRDPQQEDILKEQKITNKLLNEYLRPDIPPEAALMLSINSGIID